MTCSLFSKYSIEVDATMAHILELTQRDFKTAIIKMLKNLLEKGRYHVWRDGHYLAPIICDKKSDVSLVENPFYMMSCFLVTYKILSLTLAFDSLVIMCLGVGSWDLLVHSPTPTWCLLDSQQYARNFQGLMWTSHSLVFLFGPLDYPIVCSNSYLSLQAAMMFNNCLWLFLTNTHCEKVTSSGQPLSHIK